MIMAAPVVILVPMFMLFAPPTPRYAEKNLTVELGCEVTAVDPDTKKITYKAASDQSEKTLDFSKLFLATGCSSLNPNPAMYSGPNVFPIRSEADAAAFVAALETPSGAKKNVVIIGGGYIGLEVAAAAVGWTQHVASVTILNMDGMLMQRIFKDAPGFAGFLERGLADAAAGAGEIAVAVKNGVGFKDLAKDGEGKVGFRFRAVRWGDSITCVSGRYREVGIGGIGDGRWIFRVRPRARSI